jgi:hypothetical protein
MMAGMRTTDYIINAVFVLIVFRQARERELDRRSVIIPLAIVVYVAHLYGRIARSSLPRARAINPRNRHNLHCARYDRPSGGAPSHLSFVHAHVLGCSAPGH